jgi:hypothetical protein
MFLFLLLLDAVPPSKLAGCVWQVGGGSSNNSNIISRLFLSALSLSQSVFNCLSDLLAALLCVVLTSLFKSFQFGSLISNPDTPSEFSHSFDYHGNLRLPRQLADLPINITGNSDITTAVSNNKTVFTFLLALPQQPDVSAFQRLAL